MAWAKRKVHCIPVVDKGHPGLVSRAERFCDGRLEISESAPWQIFRVILGFNVDLLSRPPHSDAILLLCLLSFDLSRTYVENRPDGAHSVGTKPMVSRHGQENCLLMEGRGVVCHRIEENVLVCLRQLEFNNSLMGCNLSHSLVGPGRYDFSLEYKSSGSTSLSF